jgi:CBS domain-containing protein
MTADPACCTPETPVREAAEMMRLNDCGCIPVLERDSKRLVGVVTDRDIVCRGVAEGRGPGIQVRRIMTGSPQACHPDDDIAAVEQIMMQAQVRRVPVVDERGDCVGMISQADLARTDRKAKDNEIGRVVERISERGG